MIISILYALLSISGAGVTAGKSRVSNDPLSTFQWPLMFSGQTITREIDDLRSHEVTGSELKSYEIAKHITSLEERLIVTPIVAIIDSGVDLDHEDLQNSIYKNEIECDQGKLPFPSNSDRDQNGFPGDCMGWNFTAAKQGDNRPYDDKGHGTHVAGLISATANNGIGIRGVSEKIKILPLKVLKGKENSETLSASSLTERVANAINYAVSRNVHVINLSLGWPKSLNNSKVDAAIKNAIEKGIIIVAAAGNNGTTALNYPCLYDDVICVGATSIDQSVAPFSNRGFAVDVYAPGEGILSTYPKKITSMLFSVQGYEIKNGTSQAAPFISAIAALLKGAAPSLRKEEIISLISKEGNLDLESPEKMGHRVYPKLKSINSLTLNSDGVFTLPIKFTNYGDTSLAELTIRLTSSMNSSLLAEREEQITISANSTHEIVFSDELANLLQDNRTRLTVTIKADGNSKTFESDIEVVRKIDQHSLPSIELLGFDIKATTLTVSDRSMRSKRPSYYQISDLKDGQILRIFHSLENLSVEAKFDQAEKILSVQKLDLNLDGTSDLLVRTLDSKKKIIRYHYRKNNLKELFLNSTFDFTPEVFSFDPAATHFSPQDTMHGRILFPISIGTGKTPSSDIPTDPWLRFSNEKERHLFYLTPNFTNNTLVSRILDNHNFLKQIDHLKMEFDDEISVVSFQGLLSDLQTGTFNFIVAVGNGFSGSTFNIRLSNFLLSKIEECPLSYQLSIGGQSLAALQLNGSTGSEMLGSNFVSLQSDSLLLKEGTRGSLFHDESELQSSIMAFMPSFISDDFEMTPFQTKRELVLLKTSDGSDVDVKRYPIKRSSFLDSDKFTELFTPAHILGRPAFYVDATAINSGHIYLITTDSQGQIIAPVASSILLPDGCSPMNPVYIDNQMHMSFKCFESEKTVIRLFKLNSPR